MDRDLVQLRTGALSRLRNASIRPSRTRDIINGVQRVRITPFDDLQRSSLVIRSDLEVKQVVRSNTKHPLRFGRFARGLEGRSGGLILVFEDNTGDVDGLRVEFRRAGDGVVACLEAGDCGYHDVEGDSPLGDVFGAGDLPSGRVDSLVSGGEKQNFSEGEAGFGDVFEISLLVTSEFGDAFAGFGTGSVIAQGH